MPIVPAEEHAYRLKIRRRLTLDLFTRHGTFWTRIDAIREQWRVEPLVAIPPEPAFHVEAVALMTRSQMPERVHMPDPFDPDMSPRLNAGLFLNALREVWKQDVARPGEPAGDWRNGGNVAGWTSWAPFLSACVLYDPPRERLLDYAEHDDHNAAALPQRTFSQDGDSREQAGVHHYRLRSGELAALRQYVAALRESYIESNVNTPPFRTRGRPALDDLLAVQCAIWRERGMTSADIGRVLDRGVRDNSKLNRKGEYPSIRERSDAAEAAIRHGTRVLHSRNAWARITAE